jgi:4a-hydroxytetrahydrobiopterin dehydratase
VSELLEQTCKPCEGGVRPLSSEEVATLSSKIDTQWSIAADNNSITRECRFKNYYQTIAFVNSVAWIAHAQDHHPDLEVGYNRCQIVYSTHAIGGLSQNDFICAAKIDALFE